MTQAERAAYIAKRTPYFKRYSQENSEKVRHTSRASHLKRKYGLTIEDIEAYFVAQGGKCAVCRDALTYEKRGIAVDHCHATGRVRGLLCRRCNHGLGFFRDNLKSLERAVAYLLKDEPPARLTDVALTSDAHTRALIYTLNGRKLREQNVLASAGR